MSEVWTNHLLERAAVFDAGSVSHFGARPTRLDANTNALCDLSHYGVIHVTGVDAAAFLQGQFTNDVLKLEADHAQWNGWCSPKGRLLATFLLWRAADGYCLQMPRAILPAIQKRLQLFVLRSKVTLRDASDEWCRFCVSGSDAARCMASLGYGTAPMQVSGQSSTNTGVVICIDAQRFEVIAPAMDAIAMWNKFANDFSEMGANHWDLLNVSAGVIDIKPATQDAFVPQMANFELIGGVSFKKGCYPGQEIVARTQYRGILKRRMGRFTVDGDELPLPGSPVYAPEFGDQVSGQVALAARSRHGIEVLIIGQREAIAADSLALDPQFQHRAVRASLPYTIPD